MEEKSGVWMQMHLNFARTVSSICYNDTYFTFEILDTFQFIAMWKVFYKLIEKLLIAIKYLLTTPPRYKVFGLLSPPVRFLLDIMSPCFSLIWDCAWDAPCLVRQQGFSIKARGGGGVSVPCCRLSLQGEAGMATAGMGRALRAFKTSPYVWDIPSPHRADQRKLNAEHLSISQP